jgi:hypothetical protein
MYESAFVYRFNSVAPNGYNIIWSHDEVYDLHDLNVKYLRTLEYYHPDVMESDICKTNAHVYVIYCKNEVVYFKNFSDNVMSENIYTAYQYVKHISASWTVILAYIGPNNIICETSHDNVAHVVCLKSIELSKCMFEVVHEILLPSKFMVKKTAEQVFSMYKHFTKNNISEFPEGEEFTCFESDKISPLFKNSNNAKNKIVRNKEKDKDKNKEEKKTPLEIFNDVVYESKRREFVNIHNKKLEEYNDVAQKSIVVLSNLPDVVNFKRPDT